MSIRERWEFTDNFQGVRDKLTTSNPFWRRVTRLFKTPEEAEAAFYQAIERADMGALDEVWSSDDNIVCVHPGATRIEGRTAVMESFMEMFAQAPLLSFSIVDALCTGNESLAVHQVREEIAFEGQAVSSMVSTNIYHVEDGGWRMLLHHASPEPDMDFPGEFDDFQGFDGTGNDEFDDDLEETGEPFRPPLLH
ncbi:MAG: SnoaL-like domain-containing protein [Granulosicoccus sp.]|nr:SnoaL-like domain-containing protein [Granulosicoccus sp.]